MYYTKFIMKNNVLKLLNYLYYFSLTVLPVIYLFPGSLIGYLLYGDFGKQPDFIPNPIGTSINHFFFFVYLTGLSIICNLNQKRIFTNINFIIFISVFLEATHYIIPNRAFELYDLFANLAGVFTIFLLSKLIK